jgi:hypothetical protein
MKVYASPNATGQTVVADGVDYQPATDEVLMTTTRPEGAHQATVNGEWVEAKTNQITMGTLFAILPVNDGNPVSVASQHVLVNPFPGYHVQCQAEFMYNDSDLWMSMTWNNNVGSGACSQGVSALQDPNDLNTIIVNIGNVFPWDGQPTRICYDLSVPVARYPSAKPTSVRARVKVWTIAKATSEE